MGKKNGFTIIELLIVVMLVGMLLSVALPVSYGMYASYKASLCAQEVMAYVSALRREAFLYSERKVMSSHNGHLTIDGKETIFRGMMVNLSEPVVFYRNGTSSGGVIELSVDDMVQDLVISAPLGNMHLESREE